MRVAILPALLAAAASVAAGQANAGALLPCRGEALSVRHVSDDAAMGGHDLIDYAFKNNSSSPCTLKGYPRYELLDRSGKVRRHGRAINSQQLLGDDKKEPPRLVTLAPGRKPTSASITTTAAPATSESRVLSLARSGSRLPVPLGTSFGARTSDCVTASRFRQCVRLCLNNPLPASSRAQLLTTTSVT